MMQYLGGKSKIARKTADAILALTSRRRTLVEPFVGAGSMTAALSSAFALTIATDIHPDLILLHKAVAGGWQPPDAVTEQNYAELRRAEPSPLRGFVGFGASFGGRWFEGYARNSRGDDYAGAAKRGLLKKHAACRNVHYVNSDYRNAWVEAGDVVYCDPPYAGTKGYTNPFDPVAFWRTADTWASLGASVFVSEYKAPLHWCAVWSETRSRAMRSNQTVEQVTERLFVPRAQA